MSCGRFSTDVKETICRACGTRFEETFRHGVGGDSVGDQAIRSPWEDGVAECWLCKALRDKTTERLLVGVDLNEISNL